MRKKHKKRACPGLLAAAVILAAALTGCGGMTRYQTMELNGNTVTMGETGNGGQDSVEDDAKADSDTENDVESGAEAGTESGEEGSTESGEEAGMGSGEEGSTESETEAGMESGAEASTETAADESAESNLNAGVSMRSADAAMAAANPAVSAEAAEIPWNGHTVAVDAGHQAKPNSEKEPIGPSSETMKAKMPAGSVGAVSGVKEYELTLTLAKKLETELKNRGYHVVMIRTGHDVNLSNAERSAIANESEAEILIRLHANSMDNSSVYGALSMCMTTQNPYNAELHDKSYSLSKKLIDQICGQTGTKNRGVQEVDNFGEINWSEIPVSVVEVGFLSNPDEDTWLQDEGYQDKLVAGMAGAVDSYFAEGN